MATALEIHMTDKRPARKPSKPPPPAEPEPEADEGEADGEKTLHLRAKPDLVEKIGRIIKLKKAAGEKITTAQYVDKLLRPGVNKDYARYEQIVEDAKRAGQSGSA